jgi:membrane-bound serine protease (ClpP class)
MWTLSPDAVLLFLTLGVALIYVEMNRPGSILPGAAGMLLTLLSVAALGRLPLAWWAVVLGLTGIALLVLDLLRPTSRLVATGATLALVLGFMHLVTGPAPIHSWVAVPCGILLGAGTSILTRIARRARANKAVD